MPNESAKIILAATHGKLTKVRDCLLIEDSINSIQCQFEFRTSDWDNTTKTAVFFRGWATPSTPDADTVYVILDESNTCYIPSEILNKNTLFSVGVFGTSDDYRIVSNWMYYKIKDGCFAEGSSPSGSTPSAYEQLLKELENHQHDDMYYTKDESEDRFVSQEEINNLVATPDWDQSYIDMPGFIKNRTHYEYKDEEYSSDILAEPTVGVHLVKDLSSASQYMLSYYTTDSLNNFKGVYYYKVCFEAKLFSKWQNLEKNVWWTNNNAKNIDGANSKIDVNSKKGMYMYVITDRSLLSSDDAIKFPKLGVYIDVTNSAVADVMKNISLVQMHVKRLEKRFLPDDAAYLSDVESQIEKALVDSIPDWNQNDESASNYIQNRPFYKDTSGIDIGTLQFTATGENTIKYTYSDSDSSIFDALMEIYTKKQELKVSIAGKEFTPSIGFSMGIFFFNEIISGNLYWMNQESTLTINDSEISLVSGNVYDVTFYNTETKYYKIDINYIPDEVYTTLKAPIYFGDGNYSTIQGYGTKASKVAGHAEGYFTFASSSYQHTEGKYNIEDTNGKYVHITGNGSNLKRSNAHTLDWSGNAWFAGSIKIGGTGQDDSTAKEIATKEYIDNVVNEEELNAMLEEALV